MVEGGKDAVREGLVVVAGVEFVGLRSSGGVVGAYLLGDSEPAGVLGPAGLSEFSLWRLAAWFSRFGRIGECDR